MEFQQSNHMVDIRPVLVTKSDSGGAGTALYRIHQGLHQIGINSRMYVHNKSKSDNKIIGPESNPQKLMTKARSHIDDIPLRYYDSPQEFSVGWVPSRINKKVKKMNPDIVHLNWIGGGFMNPLSIKSINTPIVWRLPDMWPMTGGCHFAEGCTRYKNNCGRCPKLNSNSEWDITRFGLKQKKYAVENANVTVVANSSWLASQAKNSTVLENCDIEVIPNAIDTTIFRPIDKQIGREILNLPKELPLVLYGADNPNNTRKGPDLLENALNELNPKVDETLENFGLSVFGNISEQKFDFNFPVFKHGYISDEKALAILYSAADLMIVPSRYEGLPNTILEAMAAGTPVVAFEASGMTDAVNHLENGYLAEAYNVSSLAEGIRYLLNNESKRKELGENAREWVLANYKMKDIAKKYKELYQSIL